ncbi:hypothetical protein [Halobaculum magnesiiphilum]|uniref:Uncharacterized protein n=1 Tax=Halobaculum magnesiiphilum TaxID=1017351 RepID=A0A8T8WCT2_9EURY|nr:hypothetical protein [Halobaculum magnesiiphilum]QZP37645.1 hypothetical protein K6T50_00225 [Halobaculum magnesiiphilum]
MRPRRTDRIRLVTAVAVVATVLAIASGSVSAHNVGATRYDAPIPPLLLFGGAAATVLFSGLVLALAERSDGVVPDLQASSVARSLMAVRLPTPPPALRATLRVGFLAAFAGALAHGLVGPTSAAENAVTIVVWSLWLRGLALVATLGGTVWPTLSPWRTVYDGLCRLEGEEIRVVGRVPDRVADGVALVGFLLGIGVLATLTSAPRDPRGTAGLVLAYAAVMLVGGVCFGREWFDRGDFVGAFYRILARVAPVRREGGTDDAGYRLRTPWAGTLHPAANGWTVLLIVATVYVVSFDGFTNTPEFRTLLDVLRANVGAGPEGSLLVFVLGFGAFVGAFLAVVGVAARVGTSHDGSAAASTDGSVATESTVSAARAFAPTLVPIAAAYEVAHNYPYVAASLGQLVPLVLEPFGVGVGSVDPLAWLPLPAFWASQVVLVVVGHLFAVIAAHEVASRRYPDHTLAGHAPLLVVMVAYTVVSLWIVSRPVVTFG